MKKIAAIRKDYMLKQLSESDTAEHPLEQFNKWFDEALKSEIDEINAMMLATTDENNQPHARIVLLKGVDERGFSFFTNYNSHKGVQLKNNNKVALVFFWKELERQVRIEGISHKLPEFESDAYFESRPEISQIGAWASPQSQIIPNREALETAFESYRKKFEHQPVCRPPHWGGFVVTPHSIEFWQGRTGRLHDRILYSRNKEQWIKERLAP
jgi:pyridoxamine 5'-phosphate oxidase